ncbi:hypothetical protein M8C21_017646 [Ambrosia artemisiifolia]|uniref:MACPF domain-containing protein n=1 Tax=Ambrosia artemisiifolia TaxID=4212 RepID=A0AAD5CHC2_AMBAR|nr:hypothetical protein M8C21_017646 [Ambrosia artemisiifolia]
MDYYSDKPIEQRAFDSLGLGFDFASDFRLKFAKSCPHGGRLVELDESRKRDIVLPGSGVTVSGVSVDIHCDKGEHMSELLNQNASVQGKVPSGYFNAFFDLTGAWLNDAAEVKHLAFDAYYISLYSLYLTSSPLVLRESVKKSVPTHWNPALLARFIQTYGTHIIVGMGVGGQDVICVKQKPSSTISPTELRGYLEDLGDFFSRMLQPHTMQFTNITETSSKDGLTIINSKRGGDVFSDNHSKWLQTVGASPEAIRFKFVPITSLLNGVPGSGYLSHAINLYLRYKPPTEDLQYFLEFQVPRQWAPLFCELPLQHLQRKTSYPWLQFGFMGPKMYLSTTQVSCSKKPIIGLRLFLEGKKNNRLAIHVQHLSSLPNIMTQTSLPSRPCQWRGSDEYEPAAQFLEPIRWKRYSNICSSVVKHDPNWLSSQESSGVFIVTGAQLVSKGKWPKTVLHLRLLYTHLPHCTIRKTEWAQTPSAGRKSSIFTNLSSTFTFTQRSVADAPKQLPATLNSGVYPEGPPVPIRSNKMRKYVDVEEVVRGSHDMPGHWLVTAAKLVMDGGKIGLHVKFALLDFPQEM